MFKRFSFLIFSPYLLSIFIRSIVAFFIICIIIPKFSGRLQLWHIRIEICILIMILVEILISRIKTTNPNLLIPAVVKEAESSLSTLAKNNLLTSISQKLIGRNCIFFLATSTSSLAYILPKFNYCAWDLINGKENGIQIFDDLYKLVISFNLEKFRQLSTNPESSGLIIKLLQRLGKNKCSNINLLVSIDDLIKNTDDQEELYRAWYLGIQSINNHLGSSRFNINLIIDNIAQIEGFAALFANHQALQDEILGICFFADLDNTEATIKKFAEKFKDLLQRLETILIHSTYLSVTEYQLAYMFIQQLANLEVPINKLLQCIKTSKNNILLSKKHEPLITISFINSQNRNNNIIPLISPWLQPHIEELKIKNG
ncbi:ImcF-like family type VI secretion N-terminal domain protein (plasmid) [Candidatus Trichorickettsia mobilis]|uniref:type VI secretion protein IcmF/TssM N-terminal domain-containing protein n=1 Tax=Candidatus Trichorickettsia mobilis TaxID=1346319 RepID=UPI002B263DF6|nr:type VI secretion protein IcmF/TssM N-terminal domain-containing protein [Candidatus Trichorickettsia mobilis]WPY01675.1 ImcF-like family type VI secretion N-terminal domain protein [Candidatus Trichorickettsia mobilis]